MTLEELVYKNANIISEKDIILNDESELIEDFGYDSLSMVKLIIEIENEFNIEIDDFSELSEYGSLRRYVHSHAKYPDFYEQFLLGDEVLQNNDYEIVVSQHREKPINKKYYYSLILSRLLNRWIFSCSKEMLTPLTNLLTRGRADLSSYLADYTESLYFEGYSTRRMLRMLWDRRKLKIPVPDQDVEYIYIEAVMKYAAQKDGETLSYCKFSDVEEEFGNIVIYTDEKYRCRGFAAYLLFLLLDKCNELSIYPMYVVDVNNVASVNLAKKMGFSVISEEIVVSKEVD